NPKVKHPIFKDFLTTALFLNKKHRKTDTLNTDVGGKVFRQYISQAIEDTRFRSYIVDITEHKKMDRMKDEFVGSVSHELRTPLSITKEAISLVLDRVTGDLNAKQEKILTAAKYNIERLTRIVNDLLDISKIELGRIDVNRKAVDLNDLVETVIFNFTPAAKEKGLKLKTNLCNSVPEVYADQDRVIQVLNNLLNNALKFTKDGYIEISTSQEEDEFKCTVADTGAGISENDMQHVFDKFKQFGRVSGPGEKGTGLGLSISKKIIEMHNGRIWATSRIDAGSKFMFTLPKYDIERIFKHHINERVNNALKGGAKLSLIIASLPEYDKLEREVGREKLQEIAKNIEAVLHGNLRAPKDVTLKGKGEVFILLLNCTKENSYRVGQRLREALNEYLERQKLADKLKVRFGYATCPDDAETDIGLIEHTKKIERR
ncbi:ATP-binding protein, partial [Candidatus Omnitrophota bacterium]